MATTFPTSIDSYTTNVDGVDVVTAADINNLQDAVRAIETILTSGVVAATLNKVANSLVKRGPDGSFAGEDIVAVGQLTSTSVGGGQAASGVLVKSTTPAMAMMKTNAGADSKIYDWYLSATQMIWRAVSDDELSATEIMKVTRSGMTISSLAVLTALTVSGILVASAGVAAPRSSGSALFAMDSASTGLQMTVANAAASYIFGNANNFSGLILANETSTDKSSALFIVGNGVASLISDPHNHWAASNTASRSCVYTSANAPVIHNNRGASRTYSFMCFRVHSAN